MGCNGRNFQELPPDWNCHVRVDCNGLQWEYFSGTNPSLKFPCISGLQWAAMGGLFRNYPPPPDWNCHVGVGCNGLQWEDFFRNYPPQWICQVRVGCNGIQWKAFSGITPHDWNCHVRAGRNGLHWEDILGITTTRLNLPCKSGLQWTAMGGHFRNYPFTENAM